VIPEGPVNAAFSTPLDERYSAYAQSEKLAEEITELASYIFAATYQLLTLIREFDQQKHWEYLGMASCAHWLNFKCGIGMHAAREKVRVANALAELPTMSERFKRGELSYSKVRAMTRIANADNEDYLLSIARHGTAHHVEKLVSQYRRCVRLQDTKNANEQHEARELSYHYDENGCLVITAKLPAEQGAVIMKALERAMDSLDSLDSNPDVPAGTPNPDSFPAQRADALAEIAENYLNTPPSTTSTADRYQVVVHVSPETLEDCPDQDVPAGTPNEIHSVGARPDARSPSPDVPAGTLPNSARPESNLSHIENAPHIAAETSRRIACDCSIVHLTEDKNAQPLSISRKSRSIPPSINRALRARDQGCRFPGCTSTEFIDGHHIKHWADGGETSLENLVQLCRKHHRLVHEGGFGCERAIGGKVVFTDQRGEVLADSFSIPSIADEQDTVEWIEARFPDLDIDAETCVPLTRAGETIDWDLAVGHLFG
jgi:hypothetical protein